MIYWLYKIVFIGGDSVVATKQNKTKRAHKKATKTEKEFGLNKSEIENIFDIIEKEWGV